MPAAEKRIRIVEVKKGSRRLPRLRYAYTTQGHYGLSLSSSSRGWRAALTYRPLPRPLEKKFESRLFAPWIEEPRVFVARVAGDDVGWLETSYEAWNERLRVCELLVEPDSRGCGVGAALMRKAEEVARRKGARMVVLETQSCNVPAIRFYRRCGYELFGFDAFAYSNEDVARGEVRLELGRELRPAATSAPIRRGSAVATRCFPISSHALSGRSRGDRARRRSSGRRRRGRSGRG